ncbi:DUF6428 family protein [Flavobacteriales bacterium]|nr:DUF6428 family protein [Flavobacteriales bacterium]
MKLLEFKNILRTKETIAFELPNGKLVPSYFHFTEVGGVEKNFIDCGGTIRKENRINFQLWEANDYDHRLHPDKLVSIIDLSIDKLQLSDEEIEVEYQGETIGKYFLDYQGGNFLLTKTLTDCLAKDNCGIPVQVEENTSCAPGSGCC